MNSKHLSTLVIGMLIAAGAGFAGGTMSKQQKIALQQNQLDNLQEKVSSTNQKVDNLESELQQVKEQKRAAEVDSMTPADDLRVNMNGLLKEHVDLGLIALRSAYDGDSDKDAAVAALDQNSQELAATVGSVYGDEAETQFLELWRAHIGYFVDYTVGLKTNNQTKMDQADENLEGYAENAGIFFSEANPNIPKSAVVNLAEEHKTLVIASMEAYDAGNYEKAYEKEREANKQVSKIADALSGGIIKQFPDKFRE